jgi:hypothetical protein
LTSDRKSVRAESPTSGHVRFAPESDRLLRCREMTRSANTDQSALQQNRVLFDVLVGGGEQRLQHSKT